jgi:hypothetical protein
MLQFMSRFLLWCLAGTVRDGPRCVGVLMPRQLLGRHRDPSRQITPYLWRIAIIALASAFA